VQNVLKFPTMKVITTVLLLLRSFNGLFPVQPG